MKTPMQSELTSARFIHQAFQSPTLHRWLRLAFLAAALTAGSAGCGELWMNGRLVSSSYDFARSYSGGVALTLLNDLPVPACYVRMGPSTEPVWGNNWLPETQAIPTGGARTFYVAGAPQWDIQVTACDGTRLSETQHIPVLGPTQLLVSSLRQPTMTPSIPAQVQPPT